MKEQFKAPKMEASSTETKREQELKKASWVTAKEWPTLFFYKLRNRVLAVFPTATVASMSDDEWHHELQFDIDGISVIVVEDNDWPFVYKAFVEGDIKGEHKDLKQLVEEIAEEVDRELPKKPTE